MRRLIRWFAIVLGGLVGLFAVALVTLYIIGLGRLGAVVPNLAVETIAIPTDAAAIGRGDHVATIWGCRNCHGADLGGQGENPLLSGTTLLGSVSAPNLTVGRGGIGGAYTDADWVRAIRHGVGPDGRGAIAMRRRAMSGRCMSPWSAPGWSRRQQARSIATRRGPNPLHRR